MNAPVARPLADEIRARLAHLQAESLEVFDDSSDHAGHAGAMESGGGHFHVVIVSAAFSGLGTRWVLFWLVLAQGIVVPFNPPAWQVLTPRLVPRKDLTAAITLNEPRSQSAPKGQRSTVV